MENGFYSKEVQCPICRMHLTVLKVKSNSTRIVSRDEDFCPRYEPINALLYSVWICPQCGYAAMDDKFEKLDEISAQQIKNGFKGKWVPRDIPEERTLEAAIDIFKIALLNLNLRKAKGSEIARVCLRIAWFYRMSGNPKEKDFLQFALDSYMSAFENETFPTEILDEITCFYMIGELNRRLGNYTEAGKWYHKVISAKNVDQSDTKVKTMIGYARDQIQTLREEMKEETQ